MLTSVSLWRHNSSTIIVEEVIDRKVGDLFFCAVALGTSADYGVRMYVRWVDADFLLYAFTFFTTFAL